MEASGFRPGVDVERDPAPNLPADQGLASLGLLMQLGGSIFLALNLLIAIMTMMAPGGRGSATFWLFAIGAAGAIRSGLHRAAGTTLAYSSAGGAALRAMKAYLIAAGLQTVFTLWALHELGMRGVTLTFAGALAAWPLTLLVVTLRPRIRAVLDDALPVGPDFGLEGTGVLMALLG